MLIAQNNMSDSEFDIVDVADGCEFEIEGEEVRKKGRGKDIYLVEYATFEKPERFKFSKVFNEIKESMTKKKEWKTMENNIFANFPKSVGTKSALGNIWWHTAIHR